MKEAEYIREEARTLFRQNAHLTDEQAILEHIREAESRMELAKHYGIPYPRLSNVPPHTLAAQVHRKNKQNSPDSAHVSRRTERNLRDSLPSYLRSYRGTKNPQ
ncbi:hypothetical protein CRM22_007749 [Opisthorchis felineus]|uniref:Complex 1 LYR protein domain-containing protein n=1 Tax=Opisthorchis felineus TaxID=147828 RepID=A0A4S2LLD8_OPIFE|nr:hypothetical protein CRM22_007749 [Opisthorchis felineus]